MSLAAHGLALIPQDEQRNPNLVAFIGSTGWEPAGLGILESLRFLRTIAGFGATLGGVFEDTPKDLMIFSSRSF